MRGKTQEECCNASVCVNKQTAHTSGLLLFLGEWLKLAGRFSLKHFLDEAPEYEM